MRTTSPRQSQRSPIRAADPAYEVTVVMWVSVPMMQTSWNFDNRYSLEEGHHADTILAAPAQEVEWTDPVTGSRGFLVIHNLVGGMATGGTRMRAGCDLSEVRDLARGMAIKTAAFQLPVGGAKAGLDIDPERPEALEVLERFFSHLRPWLDHYWVTAEDLGVTQATLDAVFARLGMEQSYHAAINRSDSPAETLDRIRTGFRAEVPGGVSLAKIIGGYGVAQAAVATAQSLGWSLPATTAAVQGIGTIGGATAMYLHQAGVSVVALADAAGTLYDPAGLDVPSLLELRDAHDEIDRTLVPDHLEQLPSPRILTLTVDLLIPAAYSYAITEDHAPRISARAVIEGANSPTTPEAEQLLAAYDVPVIPDFIANAGAAAWTWWILQGLVGTDADDSLIRLQNQMHAKVEYLMTRWTDSAVPPRHSARDLAVENYTTLS